MNKITEKMLTQDSVYETEQLLGDKHWSEFSNSENAFCLLKLMEDNQNKQDYFKGLGDTYYGMKWVEFKKLIINYGFIPALEYDFEYSSLNSTEELIIYYHPTKGLVLCATSFDNKDHINGGELYGEIEANSQEDERIIWKWLSTGGCIKGLVYETQQDIREGLFSTLNELETAGKFLSKWTKKDSSLWFVDYAESKVDGYDYKAITQSKIEKCPQEFRDYR